MRTTTVSCFVFRAHGRLGLERVRLVVGDAHQCLLASTLGEPFEVAADRGAHVVELALLAHGRTFPFDEESYR